MPSALSYPGVYVEEIPSGVRTITGVATSVTAFIGNARKGPVDDAVDITSYADYERRFGGLWLDSTMSYAVRDFFLNGGARAVIVRLFHSAAADAAAETNAAVDAIATAAGDAAGQQGASGATVKAAVAALPETVRTQGKEAADIIGALADAADAAAITAAIDQAAAKKIDIPAAERVFKVGTRLELRARNPGKWSGGLQAQVAKPDPMAAAQAAERLGVDKSALFNLTVIDTGPGGSSETFLNLNFADNARRIDRVLASESEWVTTHALPGSADVEGDGKLKNDWKTWMDQVQADPPEGQPPPFEALADEVRAKWLAWQYLLGQTGDPTTTDAKAARKAYEDALRAVVDQQADSAPLGSVDFLKPGGQDAMTGLYALERLFTRDGIFNLLCIPPYKDDGNVDVSVVAVAAAYCEKRRAMLLVDPPAGWAGADAVNKAVKGVSADPDVIGTRSRNAALFFPRLRMPNPLRGDQVETFAPCGLVAGIFARTDTQRGVWKSPAGLEAGLVGVTSLDVPMTDEQNGLLNPLGINCLRTFPVYGRVVWGARTLRGADAFADEYKYVAVRRTALYIEESLYRALKWVVFEPNDESLWAQIRLNVGAFMHNLFRQGAFQGASARDAYFVRCDASTTTQNDINLGIVNVNVGFAPLKPAEFVVIRLQQIAGQIET